MSKKTSVAPPKKAAKTPTTKALTLKALKAAALKAAQDSVPVVAEFRVWCERCSIRIAPNEERMVVRKKAYHANCYSKVFVTSKLKEKSEGRLATG